MIDTSLTGTAESQPLDDIFVGDSEMAQLMRAHDWTATPLGQPTSWPTTLKVALRLLLTSKFEMWLGWGPDIAFFYNDAYRPTLGSKHPRALAVPTQKLWPEIWDDVAPRIRKVYDEGAATWDRALLLVLNRHGYPEETYHTFSYSPLLDDSGRVGGLFCAVSEETDRVISERRMATLSDLAAGLATVDSEAAVFATVAARLGSNQKDLPFTLCYLFDPDGSARLAASTGGIGQHAAAAATLSAGTTQWRADRIFAGDHHGVVDFDALVLPALPAGAWDQPARRALVVPLAAQGCDRPAGMLVAAVNPYRQMDRDYSGFVQLVAGQIAAALSNSAAYEAERARAQALAQAVTLREQAAEALAKLNQTLMEEVTARTGERDRLRSLFQQAPGFMCVLRGTDFVFELINQSYLKLVGHRDLVGKPLREALPEIAGQGYFEILDEVMASGRPFTGRSMRARLQREPDSPLEERFLDLVYQPIFAADGSVAGIFAEGSDVTEQVHAQDALRALNETLELRVSERTAELADALTALQKEVVDREAVQDALRQSQKMEAVGQLTGGIAHDFNNLLTGVLGSLDMLQKRNAQGRFADVERYAVAAESAAKRAAALTHRLLAFSRRQPLDPRAVDANRLVSSIEEILRRSIGEGIHLEVVRAGALWTTLCDPHQLESALLNLAINARDAMPDGGRLTIETCNAHLDNAYAARERSVRPGQYVCVCVTDTGVGMSADVMSRAFEPFFTTKPIGQGTGLGLSMIYGFAQQSNGYAKIYSELGKGTTVKIYLPRHFGPAEEIEEPLSQGGAAQIDHAGAVVLVVEDEPAVRNLVVELLQERGYNTLEANDGQAGLRILQGNATIDLLVTDVGLPGLNGRQIADAARAFRPDLRVLFMTGYAENAFITAGFLAPGMEMITKPFAVDMFASRVSEILKTR